MKEPKERHPTRRAIENLSKDLELPLEEWMQDWPFEVVKADDIDKYISHYYSISDEDEKFLLMEAVIQALTEQSQQEKLEYYWEIVKPLLTKNFSIHEYSIFYWACFESDDLSECWAISPKMRQLWSEMEMK